VIILKKSFLSYLGGKSQLSRQIIPLIPDHHCYCEAFAGAAWVFFKKPESNVEIINDINSDLITFYRVVKLHLEELIRHLKWLLIARDKFDRFMAENPESLTDIQRAVRFLYLLRTGYGARITKPSMSISPSRPSNFNLLRIEEDLSAAHLRLSRVYIENRHYSYMLEHYDRP
jgi:DNA adenine methylase